MSVIVVLVGPPGSGKSTAAKEYEAKGFVRISGDDDKNYRQTFQDALANKDNIIVDRMNFDKAQRARFLAPAKKLGYESLINVFHLPKAVCYERCLNRKDHPTVKTEHDAANALSFFFKAYQRPTLDEADWVQFFGQDQTYHDLGMALYDPKTGEYSKVHSIPSKPTVVVFDIDGTVADIEHRRHHVRKVEGQKKDWRRFNLEMVNDTPKENIVTLAKTMALKYPIVFASGRTDDFRKETEEWLDKTFGNEPDQPKEFPYELYMRPRNDSRQDNIVKEIILDFELLTRYDILFVVDDRDQVVKMWRERGITCLQVEYGDF